MRLAVLASLTGCSSNDNPAAGSGDTTERSARSAPRPAETQPVRTCRAGDGQDCLRAARVAQSARDLAALDKVRDRLRAQEAQKQERREQNLLDEAARRRAS